MEYCWAEKFPDLYKILTLFQLKEVSHPSRYCYKPTESILQEGPQCGLVALAMCIKENQKDALKCIVDTAKNQNFTYNGEIFGVYYMANLAKKFLKGHEIEVFEGDLNCNRIEEFLLDGGFILVPYPLSNT